MTMNDGNNNRKMNNMNETLSKLASASGRNKRLKVGPSDDISSEKSFRDEDDISDNVDDLSVEDEYEYEYEDDDVVNEDNSIEISNDIIYKLDNPRKFIPAFRRKKMTLSALYSLPKDLNDKVLGYLDLFDIMKLSRVCTELYHTIHTDEGELACTDTKMQRPIMHVCSPRKNRAGIDMLLNLQTAHRTKEYGKRYEHMLLVEDSHLYQLKNRKSTGDFERTLEGEIKSLKRNSLEFANIQFLGFSSMGYSGIRNKLSSISLSDILPCLLPNLQELNVSDVGTCLIQVMKNCPNLKKLEWNNIREGMHVSLYGSTKIKTISRKLTSLKHVREHFEWIQRLRRVHGKRAVEVRYSEGYLEVLYRLQTGKITSVAEFQFMIRTLDYLEKNDFLKSFSCLQEVYMDNSEFICDDRDFFNPNSHPRKHMFMFLGSKSLTRVSIKNCSFKFRTSRKLEMPQDALIKFVRNAPKLRWFRSNLNIANIVMLRRERPMVEFVN